MDRGVARGNLSIIALSPQSVGRAIDQALAAGVTAVGSDDPRVDIESIGALVTRQS